jgi:anti-anti-sigma factor
MNGYQIARHETSVYVRAHGLANMKNAPLLDSFLRAELDQGARVACVDLSACAGMDSTFMGTLVGYAQEYAAVGGRLVIVRPGDANLRLLMLLGVHEIVAVLPACSDPGLQFVELVAQHALGARERMEVVRRAHQSLIALSEANRQRFGAFLAALDADLGRLRGADPH